MARQVSSSASRPRAQITTAAPSAASSSATARPRPLLPGRDDRDAAAQSQIHGYFLR